MKQIQSLENRIKAEDNDLIGREDLRAKKRRINRSKRFNFGATHG